jgi:hypothetical protein
LLTIGLADALLLVIVLLKFTRASRTLRTPASF